MENFKELKRVRGLISEIANLAQQQSPSHTVTTMVDRKAEEALKKLKRLKKVGFGELINVSKTLENIGNFSDKVTRLRVIVGHMVYGASYKFASALTMYE